jgi:hypothetical protein
VHGVHEPWRRGGHPRPQRDRGQCGRHIARVASQVQELAALRPDHLNHHLHGGPAAEDSHRGIRVGMTNIIKG